MSELAQLNALDALIEPWLRTAKIPGAALAIVAGGRTVFARGYGYRDLAARLPMNAATIYPIASTSKAINATLLGMLVDEGRLAWDAPVREYLPRFRLADEWVSSHVTLRDLITMRTGLAGHDWVWIGNPMTRAELVGRLAYLECSGGFRDRFGYNNLTPLTAGYVAEVVTGESWENLVSRRIIEPLQMSRTGFGRPEAANVTVSYHENLQRDRAPNRALSTAAMAPVGGAIHSTVEDMTQWLRFNLRDPQTTLAITSATLAELHSAQVFGGHASAAPSSQACYALGWWADSYHGRQRVSHTGYLNDVSSSVMLFPAQRIGLVAFVNFGSAKLARLLNEHAFDLLMNASPVQTLQEKLAQYERGIKEHHQHLASLQPVPESPPSHPLEAYAGRYVHPGYGEVSIEQRERRLIFRRAQITIPLQHWHFDCWSFEETELFDAHQPHALDRSSRVWFNTDSDGVITTACIHFEPTVAPIHFIKQRAVP